MTSREEFEAWVTDESQWPAAAQRTGDTYRLMTTQQQWIAWQAARATAPAWRDAPTCDGLWLSSSNDRTYRLDAIDIAQIAKFNPKWRRWFGPIQMEVP